MSETELIELIDSFDEEFEQIEISRECFDAIAEAALKVEEAWSFPGHRYRLLSAPSTEEVYHSDGVCVARAREGNVFANKVYCKVLAEDLQRLANSEICDRPGQG